MIQVKVRLRLMRYSVAMKSRSIFEILLGVAIFAGAPAASAQDNAQIAYGKRLVEKNCARCHAVASTGRSTHPDAPPFRLLHRRYPIEDLEEALAEGISTGHPDMPEFVADPQQIGAIVAYIRTLSR